MSTHVRFATVIALSVLAASGPAAAQTSQRYPFELPAVPGNIEVPAGHVAFLVGHAAGTQNFICLQTASGFGWRFVGPQATLFLAFPGHRPQQVTTHFLAANPDENGTLRPSWQHSSDTSQVWARALEVSTDPMYVEPQAIPWLLLEAVGAERGPAGGASLSETTYLQRVNTSGGITPTAGCGDASEVGALAFVPYTADYVFYRAGRSR
jgi:hypothetical protein